MNSVQLHFIAEKSMDFAGITTEVYVLVLFRSFFSIIKNGPKCHEWTSVVVVSFTRPSWSRRERLLLLHHSTGVGEDWRQSLQRLGHCQDAPWRGALGAVLCGTGCHNALHELPQEKVPTLKVRTVVRLHGLCLRLPFLSCAFNDFFRVKHALEFTDPDVKEDLELSEDFLELCERVEKVLPRMKSFAPWTYYIKASFIWGMAIYLEMYMHYTGKRNRVQKTSEQIN